MTQANPKIRSVTIGIRNPKDITLYPLAVASELEMTELLTASLSAIFAAKSADDPDGDIGQVNAAKQFIVARELLGVLQKNMAQVITIASCDEEDGTAILKETDNEQFMDILDSIFEVNFAPLFQRVPKMLEKWGPILGIENQSASTKQPLTSVDPMGDTGLNTSTEGTGKKAASQEAK